MPSKNTPNLHLLFLLFSFSILSFSQSQSEPNQQEKQTLLQIKNFWQNPQSLTSWTNSSTSHCTSWFGINCNAAGSVVRISLPTQSIAGAVPPAICDLPNLAHLDLSNNTLAGTFPTSLYNCSDLRHLDLSQNLFVGDLPSDLDRLPPRLQFLSLSANNFTGDLPPALGRLPSIATLFLDNNLFNGSFRAVGNLSAIQTLGLANNPFAPAGIPLEFGNLSELSYLWMAETNLIGEIPDFFASLKNLEHLDLDENSLIGRIPSGIWMLERLQYVYLFKNNLTGEVEINGTIGALGLIEIDVSINQLTGPIPEDFGKLMNLTVLFMYFNQLSGEIPASIGQLPLLTDLRLFNNRLTGALPSDLGKNCPLWNLEVDDNMISGELPGNLCAGGALASLIVFDNNLTGSLPPSLGGCETLQTIMIQTNRFSGEVPAGIWSAVNLSTVIMRNNDLSGTLPTELPWNLTRLDIQNNRFSGEIPRSAESLLVFLASDNSFSGQIPASLAGISKLQSLSLGGNMITGEIPPVISSLRSLTDLNLSSNQLVGEIPPAIGSLPVLTSLDLSGNQLSGEVPPAFGNLKLNFLNLSSNRLSGEIPSNLQNQAYDQSFKSNPCLCSSNSILNLRSCTNSQSTGSNGVISTGILIFLVVLGVLFFLTSIISILFITRGYKKRKDDQDLTNWKLTSFCSLEFTQSAIIRGITEENLIGSGGEGKVYRIAIGSNRAGSAVAVKKIWNKKNLGVKLEKEFQSEVHILGSLRHTNIIKLLCSISSAESKLLVYEYMSNGSLHWWLHEKRRVGGPAVAVLDWPKRLGIAIGAARGLCYMHHDCSPPIVHRDVKSSNILLDSEFRAKIADFGLARMLAKAGEAGTVTAMCGSFGYMAPECAYTTKVNEKMDVYSFGVVLLELTTGREASDGGEHGGLADWAWRHFQEGKRAVDAIDEAIKDASYLDEIAMVLKLGLICTGTLPSTRPSMKDVLEILLRCDRTPDAVDKPQVELDVAPLLQDRRDSRHKCMPGREKDGNDCNV